MTASAEPNAGVPPAPRTDGHTEFVSPVIDCEPPPLANAAVIKAPTQSPGCTSLTPAALHRRTVRPLRLVGHTREAAPPRAAIAFADAALRCVLEVIDRRRPVAQLKQAVAPALIDDVIAMMRPPQTTCPGRPENRVAAATLCRVRLRMVDADVGEVFGTYRRGARVLAIAGRIALDGQRWRIVALQMN